MALDHYFWKNNVYIIHIPVLSGLHNSETLSRGHHYGQSTATYGHKTNFPITFSVLFRTLRCTVATKPGHQPVFFGRKSIFNLVYRPQCVTIFTILEKTCRFEITPVPATVNLIHRFTRYKFLLQRHLVNIYTICSGKNFTQHSRAATCN